jgi:photosystem II stability/assembly factor-like uncharacterized protein
MFLSHILLLTLCLPASGSGCTCDAIAPFSYTLGPADVDTGRMSVFHIARDRIVLLRNAIGTSKVWVYVSKDGSIWNKAGRQEQLSMTHLVASSGASHLEVVYRLLERDSVLERSVDEGKTWIRAKLQLPKRSNSENAEPIHIKLAVVGTYGLTVYARIGIRDPRATNDPWPGVYVSRDGGDEWGLFASNLIPGTGVADYKGTVVAVDESGLIESKDHGKTWSPAQIAQHLPTSLSLVGGEEVQSDRRSKKLEFYQLEASRSDLHSIFLVTNGGLFISHDDGRNWCLARFGSDALYAVSSIALVNDSASRVLASTVTHASPALWESNDGGRSFHRILVRN